MDDKITIEEIQKYIIGKDIKNMSTEEIKQWIEAQGQVIQQLQRYIDKLVENKIEKAIDYITGTKHFELDCNKSFRKVSKYEEAYIKRERDLLKILEGED